MFSIIASLDYGELECLERFLFLLVLSVRKPLFLTKLIIEQIISFEHRAIVRKSTAEIVHVHPQGDCPFDWAWLETETRKILSSTSGLCIVTGRHRIILVF